MGMPFQFTHSGRGATCIGRAGRRCRCRFNSRTLGRVRLCSFILHFRPKLFQFTHPGKGATRGSIFSANSITVSIHAPWEGCDLVSTIRAMVDYCFNSRTLGRVRLNSEHRTNATSSFNSRTLGRVRRGRPGGVLLAQKVSIHAPWEGCDTFFPVSSLMLCCFNSRTLGRVRLTGHNGSYSSLWRFQFTHPGKGATKSSVLYPLHFGFQFTHPGKGAT